MKHLQVPADLESLAAIRKYVKEAAAAARLESGSAYRLQLAVDEIATNVILHSYHAAGLAGELSVFAELSAQALTVTLEDTGRPFDSRTADLPTEEELALPLEERPIGGLGVYLTLKGVDEFRYETVGSRNHNIFVMRRKPAS